jgi:hypothetical protein
MTQYETHVDDLTEPHDRAAIVVRSLITTPPLVDWALHASDDLGEEIFARPVSSIIDRLH